MKRKYYSPEQKDKIIQEHLENNISVPDICKVYNIRPNVLNQWKKELFESAVLVFSKK